MGGDAVRDFEKCSHCGLCLAVCPTYQSWRREPASPRGRLELMRLQESRGPDAVSSAFIDSCLRCGVCSSTCPTGVPYPKLIRRHLNILFPADRKQLSNRIIQRRSGSGMDAVRAVTLDSVRDCIINFPNYGEISSASFSADAIFIGSSVLDNLGLGQFCAQAIERLQLDGIRAVRTPVTDVLSLPLIENGLISVAAKIVAVVSRNEAFRSIPIYGIDGSIRQNLDNAYFPREVREFARRIKDLPFPSRLRFGSEVERVVLDRTVVFDDDISADQLGIGGAVDVVEIPENLRAATSSRCMNDEASNVQDELIHRKRQWVGVGSTTIILTRNILTLCDFSDQAVLY